tara:strand:+ start:1771 stop:1989 length:219 start_codon:yes stop_codon:yes gene_type:complete
MSISQRIVNEEKRLYDLDIRLDSVITESRKEYEELSRKRKSLSKKISKLKRRRDSQGQSESPEFFSGEYTDD